ncbi:succinic semialdehyde dehydrogenase [Halococcus saccharolyticus]|uniref:Succinic semialdehyde dehydrogenase n=1 Tax=Halococcus saccharolyticus DSM 5350 TaxID=1227455 RepID=M0MIA6_9EURY|nr:succinic semialdehyde dehydrogenase [Halococcus saccharolyticus]EMA45068.1 succinic semialdehyde dehydrogenase [Halococcus saccharolyticus DSM 5350]
MTESIRTQPTGSGEFDELLEGLASDTTEREAITVEAPYTGETLGSVPAHTESDVIEVTERAADAQGSWAARSFEERAAVVKQYHDLVLDRQDELLDLVQRESGKSRRAAYEELLDVAITSRYYAYHGEDHLASRRRTGALPLLTKTVEHHHPVGVVGIIAPWNYPLTLAVSDAIPALLAGNSVVLKPAEETPFTALLAVSLLREAGLPEDVLQVITGYGSTIGPPLIERSDFLMFTGSTETGKTVAEQAGANLTKCSMELGGKNPLLVFDDADLGRTVEGAIRGSFTNAGQLCISLERFYVQSGVRDEFERRFVAAVEDLDLGTSLDYEPDVGSLASADQLEKVKSHVADTREKGATVLTGGEARPDVGPYFYEPTVLADVTPDMTVADEETFGPVVSLYEFESTKEAIERANDSDRGLNASVWTEDSERGHAVAERIECGTVNINEAYVAAWGSIDAPMGGMKESGLGRRHGREGILKYTEPQTVAEQRVAPLAAPPGVPEWLYTKGMTAALRAMKRIPGRR